jgi:hypothetical protein
MLSSSGTQRISNFLRTGCTNFLSIIAYEKDPERIAYLRDYFDKLGVKADRLSFLHYDMTHPLLPKYFSSLTIINDNDFLNGFDKDILSLIYESTRPYDGKILIRSTDKEWNYLAENLKELNLHGAELELDRGFAIISRKVR